MTNPSNLFARLALLAFLLSVICSAQAPDACSVIPSQSIVEASGDGGQTTFHLVRDLGRTPREMVQAECAFAVDTEADWVRIERTGNLNEKGMAPVLLQLLPNTTGRPRVANLLVGPASSGLRYGEPKLSVTLVQGLPAPRDGEATVLVQPVTPNIVSVSAGGAVSNASYMPQLSPGALFSLFGAGMASSESGGFSFPLPTTYNGTSVTINGVLCPLLYVSPGQINAQVPLGISVGTATVTATLNGSTSSTTVPILPTSPGIFMSDGKIRANAQHHSNGTLITPASPASPGEEIVIYGTGIGTTNPAVSAGQPAGSATLARGSGTLTAKVGGLDATVTYFGLTPGLAGLMQINLLIPPATPAGDAPLSIAINGTAAQPTVVAVAGSAPAVGPTISFFTASPATITSGGTSTLGWAVSDASSVSISGVGAVNAAGSASVKPTASTTYTLTAQGGGSTRTAQATVSVTQPAATSVTLSFTNKLIYPVDILVSGSVVSRVAGSSSGSITHSATPNMVVSYNLVRPATSSGTPIGEAMSVSYSAIPAPSGAYTFSIDNVVGSQPYFVPSITNNSGTSVLVGVNMGLSGENRCNCTVSAPGTTSIGYYRYFSNSNVRAYVNNSGYTGTYKYWGTDASGSAPFTVTSGSGVAALTLTTAPAGSSGGGGGASGGGGGSGGSGGTVSGTGTRVRLCGLAYPYSDTLPWNALPKPFDGLDARVFWSAGFGTADVKFRSRYTTETIYFGFEVYRGTSATTAPPTTYRGELKPQQTETGSIGAIAGVNSGPNGAVCLVVDKVRFGTDSGPYQ